jgi:hypothetical protein
LSEKPDPYKPKVGHPALNPTAETWRNASVSMDYAEINLRILKTAVNNVLDHLIEDLGIDNVRIEGEDCYWNCPASEVYDMSKKPVGLDVGRLRDDDDFTALIHRGQSADISYNLVHIAPLLRYIAEKIRK